MAAGSSLAGSRPPACVYGDDKAGTVTIALVGNSHAAHWFPAIELLARQRGWRLIPFTKFSCVFVDMRIWSPRLKREYTECEAWRERVVDRLVASAPTSSSSPRTRSSRWSWTATTTRNFRAPRWPG